MCYQSQLELNSPNSAERVHTHSDPAPLDAPTQSPVTDALFEFKHNPFKSKQGKMAKLTKLSFCQ